MSVIDTQRENSRSSIFHKVPPDLRRAVDIAIIERIPPTFRGVWTALELSKFGVSYTAFYRYARRVRDRVNLVEAAGLAADDDSGIDDAIQKLASRRLLDLFLNSEGDLLPREIAPLMTAHHQRAQNARLDRRLAEQSRLAWARLEHDREELRLKADALHAARSGRLTVTEKPRSRLAHLENSPADPHPPSVPEVA